MLDIMQIQEILPHRYPMLLVDRITDMELKQSIKGFKNVSISEPAFQGHFPGHPIYPGVLILEGMAQCGGVLALKSSDLTDEEMKNKVIYFMSIDKAKFRIPVRPGDRLDYELEVVKMKSSLMTLIGKAYVDGKLAAEAARRQNEARFDSQLNRAERALNANNYGLAKSLAREVLSASPSNSQAKRILRQAEAGESAAFDDMVIQ